MSSFKWTLKKAKKKDEKGLELSCGKEWKFESVMDFASALCSQSIQTKIHIFVSGVNEMQHNSKRQQNNVFVWIFLRIVHKITSGIISNMQKMYSTLTEYYSLKIRRRKIEQTYVCPNKNQWTTIIHYHSCPQQYHFNAETIYVFIYYCILI